jgi:membrane dipeptidase
MQDEYGVEGSKALIQRQIDRLDAQKGCQIVDNVRHAIMAINADEIPIFLGLEGGRLIQSLSQLEGYSDQGVKYLTITHNYNTSWADSATDVPNIRGLTKFGKDVIHNCWALNIIPDISHSSDRTAEAVIDESNGPIIASHSGCRTLLDNPRNISDALIRAVAMTNGVVHVPFARRMVGPHWSDIPKHIDHIVQLVGDDYVGIGSDLDGAVMAEGVDSPVFWRILPEILQSNPYNYSDSTIAKILGGNTMRLL